MALQEELTKQGNFLFKHRSYLPLIILIVGLAVFVDTQIKALNQSNVSMFESYTYLCLTTSLIGLFIRVITVGHSARRTSGRSTHKGQTADTLNKTGMYSLVRHPLYVGNFFMWLGVALLTENTWFIIAFIFFFMLYYERIMYAEEAFLRTKFKTQYLDWSKEVPAVVPSFKNYKKNSNPFNLKKVLRNEKNGLVALLLLFWLFECVRTCLQEKQLVLRLNWWFYAALLGILLYGLLKVLEKKNHLD